MQMPTCIVDGCDAEVPGLSDGIEHPRRDGVVCNNCWNYSQDHNHLPDEKPQRGPCVACHREAGRLGEQDGGSA